MPKRKRTTPNTPHFSSELIIFIRGTLIIVLKRKVWCASFSSYIKRQSISLIVKIRSLIPNFWYFYCWSFCFVIFVFVLLYLYPIIHLLKYLFWIRYSCSWSLFISSHSNFNRRLQTNAKYHLEREKVYACLGQSYRGWLSF